MGLMGTWDQAGWGRGPLDQSVFSKGSGNMGLTGTWSQAGWGRGPHVSTRVQQGFRTLLFGALVEHGVSRACFKVMAAASHQWLGGEAIPTQCATHDAINLPHLSHVSHHVWWSTTTRL